MTRLRKMMLEELQRRHYSAATIRCYIRTVEEFSRRFNCSPDRLGPRHIREYQAELFRKGKAPGTVTQRLAALRFSTSRRSRRPGAVPILPIRKRHIAYPQFLARRKWLHRTLLMMLYATGLRRPELTHLKLADIDSQRMVIHIRGGKGRQDRDVMLSPKLLDELRQHWQRLQKKPSVWLFPGQKNHCGDQPIDTKTVWHACREAAKRAGIRKSLHPHTLRHCFATHLLEAGADLRIIQTLLGHRDLEETTIYLHLSEQRLHASASPLDSLKLKNRIS